MITIKNLRWWIAGLLALATALNYLDRLSFPVVVGEIKKQFPISDKEYGTLGSLFLFAYAIMYAGGGRIIDLLGTRVGYVVMIVWWSVANLLTGFVSSVLGLGICRFLLGMGEGGGFPGSAKAVAEWFPPKERAMAFGIFNTGSSFGSVIAPPLLAAIVSVAGWRWVFFITGAVGFVWVLVWLKIYSTPEKSRFITTDERDYIAKSAAVSSSGVAASTAPISWLKLFTYSEVWVLMVAKFFTDSAWFFFTLWLPKYLGDVRHLNIKEIGYYAWIPYAFAGLGSMTGGWLGSWLLQKNFSLNAARKIALGISACLMPASLLIVSSPLSYAIVFFSLAMFAHQFWSANIQTLPADIFPAKIVGSAGGLLGAAGAFGAALFSLYAGRIIEKHGYSLPFIVAGLLHLVSFLMILALIRRIKPVAAAS